MPQENAVAVLMQLIRLVAHAAERHRLRCGRRSAGHEHAATGLEAHALDDHWITNGGKNHPDLAHRCSATDPGKRRARAHCRVDRFGATLREHMLDALAAGVQDPVQLAQLAHGRVRASRAALAEALEGRVRAHHRFLLRLHLRQIDALDGSITAVEARVEELLVPFAPAVRRLTTIPGVSKVVVAVLLAEIGADMRAFPTAGHLVSWACLAPRQDQSAGKRRSTRTRQGQWLKATLVQAAWAAVRKKDTYLWAQFHRLRARRGAKKAILAVAASMLTAAYHMLQTETDYIDLGGEFFQRRAKKAVAFRLVQRLQHLGYSVQLTTAA